MKKHPVRARTADEPDLTDLFCGAGGSSNGAVAAGFRVRLAANHWDLAIATHERNHPDTAHDQADISGTDPRRYPTTTVLWASPECTNHSQAKGVERVRIRQGDLFDEDRPLPDAAADRSRATMWDVPRFAERHLYRYIVVENVVESRHWIMFDAWLMAMVSLGYEHQAVYLNSMHAGSEVAAPAPQSRDRVYYVFWLKGERKPNLRITPPAWCPKCEREVEAVQEWKKLHHTGGRYRAQYVYRCPACPTVVEPYTLPAAFAIDWTRPGERIGDRKKPLAAKTLARIEAGIRRYARPVVVEAAGNAYDSLDPKHAQHGSASGYVRAWPADSEPLRALHGTLSKGVATPPMVVPLDRGADEGKLPRTAGEPLGTQTARHTFALAVPPLMMRNMTPRGGDARGQMTTPVDEPSRTMTASNVQSLVVPPMMVPAGGTWNDGASSVGDPMRARTTRDTEGIVVPPFIAEMRGTSSARAASEPLGAITSGGNHHAIVMRNNTGGAEMSTPVSEPLRTLTTHGHQSLIQWHAQYGYDTGLLRSLGLPLPAQTTVQGDGLLTGEGLPSAMDCLFRMLFPSEVGAGMAFASDYVVLGNQREQVKQYGNAVTPPASALILGRVMEALTGEPAAA